MGSHPSTWPGSTGQQEIAARAAPKRKPVTTFEVELRLGNPAPKSHSTYQVELQSHYEHLSEMDRRLVDAWRGLGDDLEMAILNAGVIGAGRRAWPTTGSDALKRQLEIRHGIISPAQLKQRTAEHEIAHAIVARELGARRTRVFLSDDGKDGECLHLRLPAEVDSLSIRLAPESWALRRSMAYPEDKTGHDGDRAQIAEIMRNTRRDPVRLRAEAIATTKEILASCHLELLELAERLARTGALIV